mgnify:CR=1 FL=1
MSEPDEIMTMAKLAKRAMEPIALDALSQEAQAIQRLTYAVLALALATAGGRDALNS